MPRSFNVSQVWFACEAMTPLKRLILGELLRQCFSPIDGNLRGPLRFSAFSVLNANFNAENAELHR